MPEFTSRWLQTKKTSNQRTDNTDKRPFVSVVSATTVQKRPDRDTDATDVQNEIRALIAELPPSDKWDIDETAAHILAMTDAERAIYYAALIHDWRAWRIAVVRFNNDEAGRPEKGVSRD